MVGTTPPFRRGTAATATRWTGRLPGSSSGSRPCARAVTIAHGRAPLHRPRERPQTAGAARRQAGRAVYAGGEARLETGGRDAGRPAAARSRSQGIVRHVRVGRCSRRSRRTTSSASCSCGSAALRPVSSRARSSSHRRSGRATCTGGTARAVPPRTASGGGARGRHGCSSRLPPRRRAGARALPRTPTGGRARRRPDRDQAGARGQSGAHGARQPTTSRFITVAEPRRAVLERAIHDVYAVEVVTESPS